MPSANHAPVTTGIVGPVGATPQLARIIFRGPSFQMTRIENSRIDDLGPRVKGRRRVYLPRRTHQSESWSNHHEAELCPRIRCARTFAVSVCSRRSTKGVHSAAPGLPPSIGIS